MKEIQILMDHIEEELDDACEYVKEALEYKESDPDMAGIFYKLSNEEMGHMEMLHRSVVNHISDYQRDHGEPPVAMKAVYDHLHKKYIAKAEKITNLQNMYKR